MTSSLVSLLLDEPRAPLPGTRTARRLSENDLKIKIRSSKGRRLVLDEDETSLLAKIIERSDLDPFGGRVQPASFLSGGDLSALNLRTDGSTDPNGDGTADDLLYDQEDGRPAALDSSNPAGSLIPIEHSIVAPNATPHAEEAIPQSVLVAMDVLRSAAPEQPVPTGGASAAPVPVSPAPAPRAAAPAAPEAPAPAQESKKSGKKPLTDGDLLKAFSGIAAGGGAVKPPLREDADDENREIAPAPEEHLEPSGWENLMLEARRKKGGADPEPQPRRTSRHVVAENRGNAPEVPPEVEAARRRAAAAVSKL
jgi:hypothetical protein